MEGRAERSDEPFYIVCAGCGMRSERSLSRSPAGGCAADSGISAWARDCSFVGVICDDGVWFGAAVEFQDWGAGFRNTLVRLQCALLDPRGRGREVWHCVLGLVEESTAYGCDCTWGDSSSAVYDGKRGGGRNALWARVLVTMKVRSHSVSFLFLPARCEATNERGDVRTSRASSPRRQSAEAKGARGRECGTAMGAMIMKAIRFVIEGEEVYGNGFMRARRCWDGRNEGEQTRCTTAWAFGRGAWLMEPREEVRETAE
ncbi:hypothetical protein BU26DRAFT_301963 [Trematosphaeria pertusa]|uniref:Uncharacterized protein n=1 Tax=Trematosphaeria pertusa TaxID=390896 RepID=A0A6A6IIM6_9PLEO|nr:uncharacterized protein BU26DRAFT_301963 [Trematosphaeria pertusa]KAF2250455.1 hypothetical protein BU26DRAFT_301963 [Trematosphaeria pertusa]